MSSIIFEPSNPKNISKCENYNKPILFYQEKICNLGERIPYGQDGKPHQCSSKPADKDSRCFCQYLIQQSWQSEPDLTQESESATPIHAITELNTKTIVVLECISQLIDHLHQEMEKFRDNGGV
jgi:hypothetical protein